MKDPGEVKLQIKVGILFASGITLAIIFAWLLGAFSSFGRGYPIHISYNFVGGLQDGAPVRLAGVTVGKVEKISILKTPLKDEEGERHIEVRARVKTSAKNSIRANSKFYINMAGVIGDRYLEITPGSSDQPVIEPGSTVPGVDPPRIDQLLSQGYGVFGKIIDFIDRNEQSITKAIDRLSTFIESLSSTEQANFSTLLANLAAITTDLKPLIRKLNSKSGRETFERLYRIIQRGDHIDEKALRKFLQEEGVKARIF